MDKQNCNGLEKEYDKKKSRRDKKKSKKMKVTGKNVQKLANIIAKKKNEKKHD